MPELEQLFDRAAIRMLARDPALERGRVMRSDGMKVGGKLFAFSADGDLVLKLPAERVSELIESGEGRVFDRGQGRPLREWVRVRPESEPACAAFMEEARAFVAALAR